MPASHLLAVRSLRRPLAAITVLSLTTVSTPTFALRAGLEGRDTKQRLTETLAGAKLEEKWRPIDTFEVAVSIALGHQLRDPQGGVYNIQTSVKEGSGRESEALLIYPADRDPGLQQKITDRRQLVGWQYRPQPPQSKAGLEEDVSRFALPGELPKDTEAVAAMFKRSEADLYVLAWRAHEDGLASLKAGDYAAALERFIKASAQWDALLQRPWTEGVPTGLSQARRCASAAQAYAQARQRAAGPGVGFESYASSKDAQAAYADTTTAEPLRRAIQRVGFQRAPQFSPKVLVANPFRVFVTAEARRVAPVRVNVLEEEARRLFHNDPAFQDETSPLFQNFDPDTAESLPPNAVVLYQSPLPPVDLRLSRRDVVVISLSLIKDLEDLLRQARAQQLGKPSTELELLDTVMIGDKVFHFFA